MKLRKNWWKILASVLVFYTIVMGFLGTVPALPILNETIRNLYFHVTMWFSMITMLTVSLVASIRYLGAYELRHDDLADESAKVGAFMAILGLLTGMVWAKFTWGDWWVNDMKLNGAAATMLVYLAYFLLRSSMDDRAKKARIAAVYNIFAYVLMIVFIMVLPRLTDSLHPGNGGNPGFGAYDLDANMRLVFYPAVIGWILISTWILQLRLRIRKTQDYLLDHD